MTHRSRPRRTRHQFRSVPNAALHLSSIFWSRDLPTVFALTQQGLPRSRFVINPTCIAVLYTDSIIRSYTAQILKRRLPILPRAGCVLWPERNIAWKTGFYINFPIRAIRSNVASFHTTRYLTSSPKCMLRFYNMQAAIKSTTI